MAEIKSAVLNSKVVEKEPVDPMVIDEMKRLKELFDTILTDIRVSMSPEGRAYLARIEKLREARRFFENELSEARLDICSLQGQIDTLERKGKALVDQIGMSDWVEQDTGVGHHAQSLKAYLELKEIV